MPAARLSVRAGGRFHGPAAGWAWGGGGRGRGGGGGGGGMPGPGWPLRAGGRFHGPAAGCAWGCGDGGRRGGWFRRRWGRRPRSGRVLSGLAGGGRRPGSPGGPWFCGRG